ncbi:MAG: hypothetical protein ABGY09_07190 [Euryarchaeota archaeon]
MLPVLLAALLLLPAGAGAIELKYRGLEPGNSNRWPGKGLLTDPGVAWILRGRFPAGTVADEGVVLANPGGEVVLVDPGTGRVVRRLAVVPGLHGPLLVARVGGGGLVVGIRLPERVPRSGEARCELVTVDLGSGGVESIRLPAVEGSVVGCLDVDGDGDDEALVLSGGLCCCELSPLGVRWRLPGGVVSVAVVPGDRPRAWATVRRGSRVFLAEVDLGSGSVLRWVDLTRLGLPETYPTSVIVRVGATAVPGVVRNILPFLGWVSGRTLVADVDGDGDRDVVCWVWGTWRGPDLQAPPGGRHVGAYLVVLERCGTALRPALVRRVDFDLLAAGDVDGDGRDELVVREGRFGSWSSRPVRIVRIVNGRLSTVAEIPAGGSVRAWLVDVTGDGRPEVLVASGETLTAYELRDGEPVAVWRARGAIVDGILPVDRDGDGVVDALVLLDPRAVVELAQGARGAAGSPAGRAAAAPVVPVIPVIPRVRRGS